MIFCVSIQGSLNLFLAYLLSNFLEICFLTTAYLLIAYKHTFLRDALTFQTSVLLNEIFLICVWEILACI